MELKQLNDQQNIDLKIKNDQLKKNGLMRVEEDNAADLHTSLEALVVGEASSLPAPRTLLKKTQKKI